MNIIKTKTAAAVGGLTGGRNTDIILRAFKARLHDRFRMVRSMK